MSDETYPEPPRLAPGVALQQPAAIVVDHSSVATTSKGEAADDASPPGALRLFLTSPSCRAGLTLFALMLLVSVWVLLTYPLDFGSGRWSSPAYWANNPRNAPPAWSSVLSGQAAVPQTVITIDQPTEATTIPAGEVRLFSAPVAFTYDREPTRSEEH